MGQDSFSFQYIRPVLNKGKAWKVGREEGLDSIGMDF